MQCRIPAICLLSVWVFFCPARVRSQHLLADRRSVICASCESAMVRSREGLHACTNTDTLSHTVCRLLPALQKSSRTLNPQVNRQAARQPALQAVCFLPAQGCLLYRHQVQAA